MAAEKTSRRDVLDAQGAPMELFGDGLVFLQDLRRLWLSNGEQLMVKGYIRWSIYG